MRKQLLKITVAVTACLTMATSAGAQGMYDQGSLRLSIIGGAGESFDDDYLILGGGIGYFVIDGLELGLNYQYWFSGDPDFHQVEPQLTYVFQHPSSIDPYVGVLYRRLLIDGLDDLSGIGGRAGVNISLNPRTFLGIGAVYVDYKSCDEDIYVDCDEAYPELTLGFTF